MIGVSTDKLTVGILKHHRLEWGLLEVRLKQKVYPMLRAMATMKVVRQSKKLKLTEQTP